MLEAEALTRSYDDFVAVADVSFRIQQGEVVGLLGHNGAGKTTIMKMLTGYLQPTGGRVCVNGRDVTETRRLVQRDIGYLPESCPLYPEMSVVDYLSYCAMLQGVSASQRNAAIRAAIERTALRDKALATINTLSRGYCQRVGVAQAILHQPGIVILDEPTNGLDPSQVEHMRALIRELAQTATVIVSTHILQEVEAVCDRVLMIRTGRLALDAGLQELAGGQRLELVVDGTVQQVRAALGDIAAITAISPRVGGQQCAYRLEYDGAASDVAPRVAAVVQAAGLQLYVLRPEQRDLEAVFREVNDTAAQSDDTAKEKHHA